MKRLLYTWRQARAERRARRNLATLQMQSWPGFSDQQDQDWINNDEDLYEEEHLMHELDPDFEDHYDF